MKHPAVRVILLLLAIVATATTVYFIAQSETLAAAERSSQQTVRDHAKGLLNSIAELKAGQRGYVAAGQGHQFWTARVTQVLQTVEPRMREMRTVMRSPAASSAMDAASVALDNFRKLDARAQEYVSLEQELLASDLIFSDGLEMSGTATMQIDTALNEEIVDRDRALAALRRREGLIAGAGGGVVLLVALLLAPVTGRKRQDAEESTPVDAPAPTRETLVPVELSLATPPIEAERSPDLAAAARVCTEFGRVMETSEIPPLLAQAAEILDAAGLVVWVSDRAGIDLKPVLSHGYSEKVMTQMRGIPRDAQNAAALAFRSAQLRIVAGDNQNNGAIVVPLVTPAGCVGVLAAELRHSGEQREATRALATILAAQLATLVGAPPVPAAASGAATAQA